MIKKIILKKNLKENSNNSVKQKEKIFEINQKKKKLKSISSN